MRGRGVRWCGGGEGSDRRFVVVVGFDIVAFEVVAVGNEGVKNAANNLWDGRRSYGGPKGEGRLIMQRGENGKRGSEGRDWESTELGKGGGRGRGVEKFGKEESRERDPSELCSHLGRLIIWGGWKQLKSEGGK